MSANFYTAFLQEQSRQRQDLLSVALAVARHRWAIEAMNQQHEWQVEAARERAAQQFVTGFPAIVTSMANLLEKDPSAAPAVATVLNTYAAAAEQYGVSLGDMRDVIKSLMSPQAIANLASGLVRFDTDPTTGTVTAVPATPDDVMKWIDELGPYFMQGLFGDGYALTGGPYQTSAALEEAKKTGATRETSLRSAQTRALGLGKQEAEGRAKPGMAVSAMVAASDDFAKFATSLVRAFSGFSQVGGGAAGTRSAILGKLLTDLQAQRQELDKQYETLFERTTDAQGNVQVTLRNGVDPAQVTLLERQREVLDTRISTVAKALDSSGSPEFMVYYAPEVLTELANHARATLNEIDAERERLMQDGLWTSTDEQTYRAARRKIQHYADPTTLRSLLSKRQVSMSRTGEATADLSDIAALGDVSMLSAAETIKTITALVDAHPEALQSFVQVLGLRGVTDPAEFRKRLAGMSDAQLRRAYEVYKQYVTGTRENVAGTPRTVSGEAADVPWDVGIGAPRIRQ